MLIIDDVISAGTSIRESVAIIRAQGAKPAGVVIALDRQERGLNNISAIQEVENNFGIRVASIVNLDNLVAYLTEQATMQKSLKSVSAYREKYGA